MQIHYMDGLTMVFGNISASCNGLQGGSFGDGV